MSRAITGRAVGGAEFVYTAAPKLQKVVSVSDTHFTGALAKGESENENITGLVANRIVIKGVSIRARQALRFRVHFFSKDSFTNSDVDKDTWVGSVDVDLANYGQRV